MVTSDRATRVGYSLAKELEKANKAFIDRSSYDPNTKTIVIFYADLDERYIDFEVRMATTDLTLENRQLKKQLEMLKAENEKLKKENDKLKSEEIAARKEAMGLEDYAFAVAFDHVEMSLAETIKAAAKDINSLSADYTLMEESYMETLAEFAKDEDQLDEMQRFQRRTYIKNFGF